MKKQSTRGFTIIEVVLVLAIAALIFLMVFVALPTLQRNQRDSERKADAGLVATAVTDFVSSNRRPLNPSTTGEQNRLRSFIGKLSQYQVNGESGDATTGVLLKAQGTGTQVPGEEGVFVHVRTKCDGQNGVDGTSRQAAVRVSLENGSVYCVDAAS